MKNLIYVAAIVSMSCAFAHENSDHNNDYCGAYFAVGGGEKGVKQSVGGTICAKEENLIPAGAGAGAGAVPTKIVRLVSANANALLERDVDTAGGPRYEQTMLLDAFVGAAGGIAAAPAPAPAPVAATAQHLRTMMMTGLGEFVDLTNIAANNFIGIDSVVNSIRINDAHPLAENAMIDVIAILSDDDLALKTISKNNTSAAGIAVYGYNHRCGNVVVGGEVSVTFAKNAKMDCFGGNLRVSDGGVSPNVNARLGYIFNDSLFFVKLGATLRSTKFETIINKTTKTNISPVVGLGIEKKIYNNLNIRLDADYTFNKTIKYDNLNGGIGPDHKITTAVNSGITILQNAKIQHKTSGGWKANLMIVYNFGK